MIPRLFVLLAFLPHFVLAQAPATIKQAPPPGIPVPAADAAELKDRQNDLGKQISQLGSTLKAPHTSLLPDVEVFYKAVHDALTCNEFFKPAEIRAAKDQLALGFKRAADLSAGAAGWIAESGSVVLGYRSRIDQSIQPYALRVPEDWKPGETLPRPLYLWFHGRNDSLSEVAFIAGELKGKREFAPPRAFELHLYGRYCNASKFAGEVDAFEAMDDVMRRYPIDTNRIAALGFSMGGATAWHMAAHHPGVWAVASAGAGFAETAIYAKVFDSRKQPPPTWEQTLWRLYDAAPYAANFANVPMIAYSGEIDPQKQSADLMEEALAHEGLKLERLIGPKTAHKYAPETKKELSRRIDSLIEKGRDPYPRQLRFVTYTLRYNRLKWLTLDALEKHWDRAEVDAQSDENLLRIETKNVAAFSVSLPQMPAAVQIDGTQISSPGRRFAKVDGQWRNVERDSKSLRKTNGLTGPIDDAFMDSFIFVRPTGEALNPTVDAWARAELDRAIVEWRRVFRGNAIVKNDTEITADDIAHYNLVLWGDPGSNRLLAQALPQLPLKWTRTELAIANEHVPAGDHAPILIYPNPLNPTRYIVINSGFTFREGSTTSNSLQTPKLPDWAIVDLRTPPSSKWPGKIASAGFFNDFWKVELR